MTKKTTKTGRELERRVANAYRAMGARKVEHDVELAGHQIDVYVEMETADRALHRVAVVTNLRRAERLRQAILKRAFEGRLVPQDPNAEPASVLLARIQAEKAQRKSQGKGKKTGQKKRQPRQLELL